MTNFDKVREFHEKFEVENRETPGFPSEDIIELRDKLIDEEFYKEYRPAVENRDIVETADALTDILYVVYGAGLAYGIDLDKCFEEVHNSNMSKLGEDGKAIRREDGKVMKGPNYWKPDLKKVLGV
jgi:predicted HAD superfamily Cof-like phosphohydrolase